MNNFKEPFFKKGEAFALEARTPTGPCDPSDSLDKESRNSATVLQKLAQWGKKINRVMDMVDRATPAVIGIATTVALGALMMHSFNEQGINAEKTHKRSLPDEIHASAPSMILDEDSLKMVFVLFSNKPEELARAKKEYEEDEIALAKIFPPAFDRNLPDKIAKDSPHESLHANIFGNLHSVIEAQRKQNEKAQNDFIASMVVPASNEKETLKTEAAGPHKELKVNIFGDLPMVIEKQRIQNEKAQNDFINGNVTAVAPIDQNPERLANSVIGILTIPNAKVGPKHTTKGP